MRNSVELKDEKGELRDGIRWVGEALMSWGFEMKSEMLLVVGVEVEAVAGVVVVVTSLRVEGTGGKGAAFRPTNREK